MKISFYPGDIPPKPGVYVFRDRFGEVIYVGKAANLRKRMSHYFQPSRETTADPKLRSLIKSIAKWEFYAVKNEDEALILESRFIKEYAPRYNILMRDDKRFLLVKINLNEKYPRLSLARLRKDDGCRYFGPFPKGSILRQTIEFLSRYFNIRTCSSQELCEKDRLHCMAARVKDCSEPCIGEISEEDYRKKIEALSKLFEGNIKELISSLQSRMDEASKKLNFEKAAQWRDIIDNIQEVFGKPNRSFRFASIPSSPGSEAVNDLQSALGLPAPPQIIEAFDISNIGGQFAVASMVCFENGRPSRKNYRRFKIREVMQSDDFAMMKEVIKRHFSRKLEEVKNMPGLLLVDGGKGQLSSALEALVEINCPPLPVIGLAKKNEEIFIPGRDKALVLSRDRAALKLLQAVRDEAHRFAVTYHRSLREKRIRESILDEIDGIGEIRKKEILKAFFSIGELRKASPAEIAEKVPGLGIKTAEKISSSLKR